MTPARLAELPLFAGFDQDTLGHMLDLMLPFDTPAGTALVTEGERGDRMHIVREGRLRVSQQRAGGGDRTIAEVGDGATIGELSLFVDGRRNATVTALRDTNGWTLGRHGFALLRTDSRPMAITISRRIGETVVARLRERCEMIGERLGEAPPGRLTGPFALPPPVADADQLDCDYLAGLLCFRRFDGPEEVREAVAGRAVHEIHRGDEVIRQHTKPSALYLVARGAIEIRVAGQGAARRVRLAGPGRFVGHLGVLDDRPSPIAARARERALLIEFPTTKVRRLLDDPSICARSFTTALYEDAARAVRQADWPTARIEFTQLPWRIRSGRR